MATKVLSVVQTQQVRHRKARNLRRDRRVETFPVSYHNPGELHKDHETGADAIRRDHESGDLRIHDAVRGDPPALDYRAAIGGVS